jgi:hypothetical protein
LKCGRCLKCGRGTCSSIVSVRRLWERKLTADLICSPDQE